MGLLLSAAAPDLGHGVAPLGYHPDLGRGVAPLGLAFARSITYAYININLLKTVHLLTFYFKNNYFNPGVTRTSFVQCENEANVSFYIFYSTTYQYDN